MRPARGRHHRVALALAAAVTMLGIVGLVLAFTSSTPAPPPPQEVSVTWAATEDLPACRYDETTDTVVVTLAVVGATDERRILDITVTAYADENTSVAVGSVASALPVAGSVDTTLTLTIDVRRPPHVDIDGVAACSLDVRQ